MEIPKLPPADAQSARVAPATTAQRGPASLPETAAPADRADIRPLDVAAALQILLAEMRSGFELPADDVPAQNPPQAARALLEVFLRAVPEDAGDAAAFTSALERVQWVMQSNIERAIGVVTAWRDVPAQVVEAVNEAHAQFLYALSNEPRSPLWLRPEWVGLAPKFQRFWRRRHAARRRLTDPDYEDPMPMGP
jgi:hypothetical protein